MSGLVRRCPPGPRQRPQSRPRVQRQSGRRGQPCPGRRRIASPRNGRRRHRKRVRRSASSPDRRRRDRASPRCGLPRPVPARRRRKSLSRQEPQRRQQRRQRRRTARQRRDPPRQWASRKAEPRPTARPQVPCRCERPGQAPCVSSCESSVRCSPTRRRPRCPQPGCRRLRRFPRLPRLRPRPPWRGVGTRFRPRRARSPTLESSIRMPDCLLPLCRREARPRG